MASLVFTSNWGKQVHRSAMLEKHRCDQWLANRAIYDHQCWKSITTSGQNWLDGGLQMINSYCVALSLISYWYQVSLEECSFLLREDYQFSLLSKRSNPWIESPYEALFCWHPRSVCVLSFIFSFLFVLQRIRIKTSLESRFHQVWSYIICQ